MSISQWIQHIKVNIDNIIRFYLVMFHTRERSRKTLSLLNHISPPSEQVCALACAVPKCWPASAPTIQEGMLVKPDREAAVLEES